MSKGNKIDFSRIAANIIKTPLETFVEDSYLPFAHYVIMSRALISDDGLKPVQRRILFAMEELGLTDKKAHMKAARIVGETMGKYHPHGDSSIGDALARMGQDFSMRVPLIDVQGSVGFTTGDTPAAPRYWEGRPTSAASELIKDLSLGAIEIGLNYDGKFPEPAMLPVKWPNGIINGSQGIAVGYSSNIVPHNPGEVMDTIIALIKKPNLTLEQIMEIMPGPDMPTGGILIKYDGVKEYYETGKGTFAIRGKYEIVSGARGTHQIIFSETPYQVSAEQIIAAISKAKERGKLKEVSQAKDLSDKDHKFKLSIGVKAGANPEVVLKDIFSYTPLEQTFPTNLNVLKYGSPVVSPMKDLLQGFIEFRRECILNKVNHRAGEIDKQVERLKGIIAILVDIDKAISIIRKSSNGSEASTKLQKEFKINKDQSEYILSMSLRRLTKEDVLIIEKDIIKLQEEKELLDALLKDEKKFNAYMIKELEETKKIIQDERRTVISNKTEEELKKEAAAVKKANDKLLKNAEVYVTMFTDGNIIRTNEPYKQERSPVGIVSQARVRTQENLVFIKKNGSALKLPVSFVPEELISASMTTGLPENSIVGLGKETLDKDSYGILVATSTGEVNIINGGIPTSEDFLLTKLTNDERIIASFDVEKEEFENKVIVMISSDGYVSKFPLSQIRTSNSGAGTVRGMNITEGETLVGVSIIEDSEEAEIVSCTHSTIKVTKLKEIPLRNRNAKGVMLQRLAKDDEVLSAFASEKVIANKNDKSLRLPEPSGRALAGEKRNGNDIILGHYGI